MKLKTSTRAEAFVTKYFVSPNVLVNITHTCMYCMCMCLLHTVWRKILTGEILTNLTNFQQFNNMFPIKILYLATYQIINLW